MPTSRRLASGVTVSAADANRQFSQLLRGVRDGRTYIVTSHGRPVARITPVGREATVGNAARRALFDRLKSQPLVKAGRWTRDELYKRG
jgi:prevent-host-death family protein